MGRLRAAFIRVKIVKVRAVLKEYTDQTIFGKCPHILPRGLHRRQTTELEFPVLQVVKSSLNFGESRHAFKLAQPLAVQIKDVSVQRPITQELFN